MFYQLLFVLNPLQKKERKRKKKKQGYLATHGQWLRVDHWANATLTFNLRAQSFSQMMRRRLQPLSLLLLWTFSCGINAAAPEALARQPSGQPVCSPTPLSLTPTPSSVAQQPGGRRHYVAAREHWHGALQLKQGGGEREGLNFNSCGSSTSNDLNLKFIHLPPDDLQNVKCVQRTVEDRVK